MENLIALKDMLSKVIADLFGSMTLWALVFKI